MTKFTNRVFFDKKNVLYVFLTLTKDSQACWIWSFYTFSFMGLGDRFGCLDLDPLTQFPIESRSNPDPKHCFFFLCHLHGITSQLLAARIKLNYWDNFDIGLSLETLYDSLYECCIFVNVLGSDPGLYSCRIWSGTFSLQRRFSALISLKLEK